MREPTWEVTPSPANCKIISDEELTDARALLAASGLECHIKFCTGHVAQQIVDFAKAEAFDATRRRRTRVRDDRLL